MGEEWKPGRELDLEVWRALHKDIYPQEISCTFDECFVGADGRVPAPLPRYSTDLMAWDWSREGWEWVADEWTEHIEVALSGHDLGEREVLVHYRDHGGNHFRAQAFARCLCVLQWAKGEK